MKHIIMIWLLGIASLPVFAQNDAASITNISIDTMGLVKWTETYTPNNSFQIDIERFNGSKWVNAGGLGGSICFYVSKQPITRNSSCSVKFRKGLNRFRIQMLVPQKTEPVEFQLISNVSNDNKDSLWIAGSKIFLEQKAYYEIIDGNGSTVAKGEDITISIASLPKGSYFLYTKAFTKKFAKE